MHLSKLFFFVAITIVINVACNHITSVRQFKDCETKQQKITESPYPLKILTKTERANPAVLLVLTGYTIIHTYSLVYRIVAKNGKKSKRILLKIALNKIKLVTV